MATRAEVAPFPRTRTLTARRRPAPPIYTSRDRLLFVLALLTFAVAVFYMAGGLLTRAYPALFPGETVPFVDKVLSPLPSGIRPQTPGSESVFNKRVNLLILGLDKRPGSRFEDLYLTDTVMVATIDPISKQASLLSFPRDLLITHDLSSGRYDSRINESYRLGFERGGSIKTGAEQVQRDLLYNFGIQTDHWMVMDFEGVENLVDSIGGIEIDVPEELAFYDWWYSDEGVRPPHWLSVFQGTQHMDGYTAVAFGRYRNGPDGDLGRIKRQQVVVQAAMDKVFSLALLNDPIGLYNAYTDTVKHDVAIGEMPGLARLLSGARGNIETYSIGDPVDGNATVWAYTTASGAAVLAYESDNVSYWLNKAFPKAAYSGAAVEVQNGFGEGGRERIEGLGRYLRFAKGVPVVYLGPPQEVQPGTSIILFREGRRELAEDIAGWLDVPVSSIITLAPPDSSAPDVIVVIGQDFILPDR